MTRSIRPPALRAVAPSNQSESRRPDLVERLGLERQQPAAGDPLVADPVQPDGRPAPLYSDVKARTGKANPAKSAVARKVLIACWHVLSREEPFKPRHPQTDPVPASSLCFLAA